MNERRNTMKALFEDNIQETGFFDVDVLVYDGIDEVEYTMKACLKSGDVFGQPGKIFMYFTRDIENGEVEEIEFVVSDADSVRAIADESKEYGYNPQELIDAVMADRFIGAVFEFGPHVKIDIVDDGWDPNLEEFVD